MKYRKKPLIVNAAKVHVSAQHGVESGGNVDLWRLIDEYNVGYFINHSGFYVTTVEGNKVLVPWGAYLVIDAKGYPYPCDADIFEATHETVPQ